MKETEVYSKTAASMKWSSATEIMAKLISPVVSMLLARLLTPEAFGVVATVTMITSFADIFTDAGFQKYLIQHDFKSREELDNSTTVAFWTNLSISVFLWVLIAVFSDSLARLVGNDGLGNVIRIAALSLPMTSFSSIQMARFKREFDFKTLFYTRLVTLFVPFFVTVPIAFLTRNYWALIAGNLALNCANAIILTLKSPWKPKFYYNFSYFKMMFSYSWWILLESIAVWLTSYIGTFVVGIVLSEYYLGLYKTSMATVNQITALITTATSMPLFVALSRLKNDDEKMVLVFRKYIQAIAAFVIPLGIGMWLYRGFLTSVLLGSQWGEAENFIGLWGLTSSFCLVFGTYCNGYFNAKGKTKLSFLAQILHLVVLIPVIIWSSKEGYETLYISRSLIRFELILVELLLMKLMLKFPVSKLFIDTLPIFAATLMMTLADVFIHNLFEGIVWNVVGVLICMAVYFISLFLFSKKTLRNCLVVFGLSKQNIE